MQRAFGTEISANERQGLDLSPYERGTIKGLRMASLTYHEIEGETGVKQSTYKSTSYLDHLRNQGQSRPRSGRPLKYDIRLERQIVCFVCNAPKSTYKELQEAMHIDLSKSTYYRILKKYYTTNWRAKKRPVLTQEVATLRLKWAKRYVDWTPEQ